MGRPMRRYASSRPWAGWHLGVWGAGSWHQRRSAARARALLRRRHTQRGPGNGPVRARAAAESHRRRHQSDPPGRLRRRSPASTRYGTSAASHGASPRHSACAKPKCGLLAKCACVGGEGGWAASGREGRLTVCMAPGPQDGACRPFAGTRAFAGRALGPPFHAARAGPRHACGDGRHPHAPAPASPPPPGHLPVLCPQRLEVDGQADLAAAVHLSEGV